MLVLLGASCAKGRTPSPAAPGEPVIGIAELARLDLLPRLKRSAAVGMVSSYDRSGGNDDGFSGKYSFVRKEPGGLVLADLEGPGVVYRIHTPTPTDDLIEFYFDGETSPRIHLTLNELFAGAHSPFLAPLVGAGVGGRYSYVPLTYQRSCKILVKAETFQFYDINFARFPESAAIPTYESPPSPDFLASLEEARRIFASPPGSDLSPFLVPAGTPLTMKTRRGSLAPGQKLTVFETSAPGRIAGLRLRPASALASKDRDILIRMTWDGAPEPAVECPVGDFFGASFGDPAVRSLLLGSTPVADGDADYIYFPMPFERSARVELVSERASRLPPVEVEAEAVIAPLAKAADEGRFYARWNRENPTREGAPYIYLRTSGRGHVVGVILQAQGLEPGGTGFFEGDDVAVIDGALAIPGTGSEDSFNGGWYDVPGRWEGRRSYPLSGCLDYKKPLGRTGGYRFMPTDSYAYRESIDYTIEHGPEGNRVPTDYASVVFFYSLDPPPPPSPLPPAADRRVTDPARIVFVPGWNVPIHTSSLQNAVLSKETIKLGDRWSRFLSLRASGDDIFGPHHVSFVCDLPEAGRYRISVKAVLGPGQGIVRIFQNDLPAGQAVDLYAPARALSAVLPLGVFEMRRGENIVYLHLTGKNPRATGLGFDLAELIFEKI